ncbi:hypothetical protein XELAEV_18000321mg [Xenopus laevis]|uniref:Uncharacterized protein n=1 Tax=Xenopus laevis TaxID=8355 RepID=A0A974GYK8_XENLA|nr:hypothetical protein XELAEV_18000321mg [Xenopus laevis]
MIVGEAGPRECRVWGDADTMVLVLYVPQCVDQLMKIQAELQETVKDLAKAKKKYYEAEQMAHAMREKADIDAKYVPCE